MDFFDSVNKSGDEIVEQRKQNFDFYRMDLKPSQIDFIEQFASQGATPDEQDERRYSMVSAVKIGDEYGIDYKTAYDSLDGIHAVLMGPDYRKNGSPKKWYEAVSDSFRMGKNTLKIGDLGQAILKAEADGDKDLLATLYSEYDAVKAENALLQDNAKRWLPTQALKAAAESLPYTLEGAALFAVGSALGVGPLLSFSNTQQIEQGNMYLQLRDNGNTHETAARVSAGYGVVSGAVESCLGMVPGMAGSVLTAAGAKGAGEALSSGIVTKLATKAMQRLGKSGFWQQCGSRVAAAYIGEAFEETMEEGLQEAASIVAESIAADLDGMEIEHKSGGEMARQIFEACKGGFLSSLVMGVPTSGMNLLGTSKDWRMLRRDAESIPSKEAFIKGVKESEYGKSIFAETGEKETDDALSKMWDASQSKRDENLSATAEEISEVHGADESFEVFEDEEDEEGDGAEAEIPPEARDDKGRLFTEDALLGSEDENGLQKGQFKAGDSEHNYGTIDYTIDHERHSITIDAFKTSERRDYLRHEMFTEFAFDHSGYDIEWNAKGKLAKSMRDKLARMNIRGERHGLNYFTGTEKADAKTRVDIARRYAANIKSGAEQQAAAVALMETMAGNLGISLSELAEKYIEAFGDTSEIKGAIDAKQVQGETVKGATTWKKIGNATKAVVYVSEHGDFSTWCHELAHAYRILMADLRPELLSELEEAYNIPEANRNGKWTVEQDERLAYDVESFLKDGKAAEGKKKELFEKIAEFIDGIYRALKKAGAKIAPEVEEVLKKLYDADDNVLSLARKAVEDAQRTEQTATQETIQDAIHEPIQDSIHNSKQSDIQGEETEPFAPTAEELLEGSEQEEKSYIERHTTLDGQTAEALSDILADDALSQQEKNAAAVRAAEMRRADEIMFFQSQEGQEDLLKATELAESEAVSIQDSEIMRLSGKERIGRAKEIYKTLGSATTGDGRKIIFSTAGFKEIKNHSADSIMLDCIPQLKELVEKSMFLFEDEKRHEYTKSDTKRFLSYGVKVNYKGNDYILRHSIREGSNGNFYYDMHSTSVVDIKKGLRESIDREANTAEIPTNLVKDILYRWLYSVKQKNPEKTLFQILGEQGAKSLDEAEDRTERIDNLNTAREMEDAGKDAKTIRLATGWEKGADGKWRYEIADGKLRETVFATRSYDEDALSVIPYDGIDEQGRKYLEVSEIVGLDKLFGKDSELLKAYPQLKEIKVTLENFTDAKGSQSGNRISLSRPYFVRKGYAVENADSTVTLKSDGENTLLHEIQHAIQEIEGFAKGGNPEQFKTSSIVSDSARKIAEYADTYEKFVRDGNEMGVSLPEYIRQSARTMPEDFGSLADIFRDMSDERILENIERIRGDIEFEDSKRKFSPVEQYRRLAGEVESRNVETRRKLSLEERRALLLGETEDVPRGEQIVLFDGGVSMSIEEALSDKYLTNKDYLKLSENERNKLIDDLQKLPYRKIGNVFVSTEINEQSKKFKEEYPMLENFGKIFPNAEMYLLPENYSENKHGDALVNKIFTDVKNITAKNSTKVLDRFEEGRLQGDNVFIHVQNDVTTAQEAVRQVLRAYKENRKHENFNEGTVCILTDKDNLVSVFKINKDGLIEEPSYWSPASAHSTASPATVILPQKKDLSSGNLLFQTEMDSALMEDARSFESWIEFMDFCEACIRGEESDPRSDAVRNADANFYMNVWEIAHNVSPTTLEKENQRESRYKKERDEADRDPLALDSYFFTAMKQEGALENFLARVQAVLDFDENQRPEDESDVKYFEFMDALKRYIRRELRHGVWLSNAMRVQKKGLTDRARKQMLSLMSLDKRAYRALYSVVMDDREFAVALDEDGNPTIPEMGEIAGERVRLAMTDEELRNTSPEDRRKIERDLKNEDIKKKLKNGTLVIDEDVESYIKSLDEEIKEGERKYKALESETDDDIKRLSDHLQREIVKKYAELSTLKGELEFKNLRVTKEMERGIALADRYKHDLKGLSKTYNTVLRDWENLIKVTKIETKTRALLDKHDNLQQIKKENRELRDEKATAERIKELRKKLVKRVMRKVDFKTIDYDEAKALIAVQSVFEPNIRGGVNRWIGTEGVWARQVWSDWKTSGEARDRITERLLRYKSGKAVIKLLEDTKTEDEFNAWKNADRKKLERLMPKQDWVRDLNLDKWKEERDGSLQLDIKEVVKTRDFTDKDGRIKSEAYTTVEFSDEIGKIIDGILGEDLAASVLHRPFAEWTTGEMEDLAEKMDEARRKGREKLRAKRDVQNQIADAWRAKIEKAVNDAGIKVNPDDPPEAREKKLKKINNILHRYSANPGSLEEKAMKSKAYSALNGRFDATSRRVWRILDNWKDGDAVNLLYWKESECFESEKRKIAERNAKIAAAMEAGKIDAKDLFKTISIDNLFGDGKKWTCTVDDLLFVRAAERINEEYHAEQREEGDFGGTLDDDRAWQALVYGNFLTDDERQAARELDKEFTEAENERREALRNAARSGDDAAAAELSKIESESYGMELPGTEDIKKKALSRFRRVLAEANKLEGKYDALIDAVLTDYDTEFERMNRASIDEFNSPVWKEKRYLPIVRKGILGDEHESRIRAMCLGQSAGTGRAGTEKGFTKKRIDISPAYQAQIETGLFSTWQNSVEASEHFIAYSGYVRTLNRVFKSKGADSLQTKIDGRYGKPMRDYIDRYIKEVADPNAGESAKEFDKAVRLLRGRTAPAYLALKLSSVLKQALSSPAPYLQFISPLEYLNGCRLMMTNGGFEQVYSKSVFMKERAFDPMVDLVKEMQNRAQNPTASKLSDFNAWGMQALEWIDSVCVIPGWIAVYNKTKKKLAESEERLLSERVAELEEMNGARTADTRLSADQIRQIASDDVASDIEREAVKKADDCVRLCQPSSRKADLAPLFKGQSEVVKALLQFTTSLNVIWNNIRYDLPFAVKNRQTAQAVGMVAGYALAGIALGVLADGFSGDDDEDEIEKARRFIWYSTTQFTDSMPMIGSRITSLAERTIAGRKTYMSDGEDLFPMLTKFTQGASAFANGDWRKAAGKFAEGAGLATGLPVSGTKEALRAFGIGDGDGEMDFYPAALLGRRKE